MDFEIENIIELSVSAAFLATIGFVINRFQSRNQNKASNNKILLKQLLESFDLDLPEELKKIDNSVVKTIKSR